MSRNVLLILSDAAEAKVVRRSLVNSRDGPFKVEWVSRCCDAIISTDVAGNVTYLNVVAESMTGWTRQEASGRPLQEVLRIIDGDSREPALNPLAIAIVHNKSVGLSANCVLIRRDGYESAIEATAAPIHDRRGQVTGAVIVFHDASVTRAMSLRMSYLAQHDFLTASAIKICTSR